MKTKIVKNCIKCKICEDVVESKTRHDFKTCSCGGCSVDGGHDYIKRSFTYYGCYEDLSICELIEEEILD